MPLCKTWNTTCLGWRRGHASRLDFMIQSDLFFLYLFLYRLFRNKKEDA